MSARAEKARLLCSIILNRKDPGYEPFWFLVDHLNPDLTSYIEPLKYNVSNYTEKKSYESITNQLHGQALKMLLFLV